MLYAGAIVALVVAETREQAADACAAVMVEYETLPFVADPEAALQPEAPRVLSDRRDNKLNDEYPQTYERGDVDAGIREAEVTVEARFETPAAMHNSMETHGAAGQWDGRTLTIYSSTQDIFGVRRAVAKALGLHQNQVRVINEYMGGGFGSKFGPHESGLLAAYAAHRLGRPVRYMLSREDENLAAGHRPTTIQTFRLGAQRDGTLTASSSAPSATSVRSRRWFSPTAIRQRTLPMRQRPHHRRARAHQPRHPSQPSARPASSRASPAWRSAVDQLAGRSAWTHWSCAEELRRALPDHGAPLRAQAAAAKPTRSAPSASAGPRATRKRAAIPKGRDGTLRRGVGMASQLWGGDGGPPAQAHGQAAARRHRRHRHRHAGHRHRYAHRAGADRRRGAGLPLEAVRVELGDTEYGVYLPPSGGSMTLASMGPAVRMAAAEARKELLEIVGHLVEAPADALDVRDGGIVNRETGREMGTLGSFLGQLDGHEITAQGHARPQRRGRHRPHVRRAVRRGRGGLGTGQVRVLRIVAVHDCGRIVNPLTFSSQIEGGIIQGLGFALMEQRMVDRALRHGDERQPGADYKVPTIRDVPEIDIVLLTGRTPTPTRLARSVRASRRSSRRLAPSPTPSPMPSAAPSRGCRCTPDRVLGSAEIEVPPMQPFDHVSATSAAAAR